MAITISDNDVRVLIRALDNYLPELRYELARVKLEAARHSLVEFEERLTSLRERLESATHPEPI